MEGANVQKIELRRAEARIRVLKQRALIAY